MTLVMDASTRRKSTFACFTFASLAAASALLSCKSSDDYAHITVDLSVAQLTNDQRSMLSQIVIQSEPKDNKDPSRVFHATIKPEQLDSSFAYHLDYTPDPQSGTFVVSAQLVDADSNQLAIKSEEAKVTPGAKTNVDLEFISQLSDGPCTAEADPVELTTAPQGGDSLAMVWDRDHYLVVYSDGSQGKGDLASVKLDESGNPISSPVFINSSGHVSILPSLVKDGDGYVVAWQEGRADDSPPVTIQIRRLDADGQPAGNIRQIETTSVEARPVLASVYGKLALAYMDDHGTPETPARVSFLGFIRSDTFEFEAGSPVNLAPPDTAPHQNAFPALTLVGPSLAVSWVTDSSSVYTSNVDENLQLSAPALLYSSEFVAQQIDAVGTGNDLFTAWEDLSGEVDKGRERIRGAYSKGDGTVETCGIVHEIDTGSANWPRLAWNGTSVAVVYYQYRDFGSQIFLTRYAPDGTRVDDEDIQFTNVAGQAKYPQIALRSAGFDGDHFGLGWIDDHTGVQRVYFQPIVCH